jgi:hypothetical protein
LVGKHTALRTKQCEIYFPQVHQPEMEKNW